MELEQVLKIADGEYATPAKRSEAARTLAAEVRRLQALAYPPQDGTEFAKIPYKQMYEAAMELIGEFNKAMAELQAENARMRPEAEHIIDENAVKRRVLGTLPLTADGCVFGLGDPEVFAIHGGSVVRAACVHDPEACGDDGYGDDASDCFAPSECYSTREAAEKGANQ